MRKKRRIKEQNIPTPLVALAALVPIFLFGYIVISIFSDKTTAPTEPSADIPMLNFYSPQTPQQPVNQSRITEYAPPEQDTITHEIQFRDNVNAALERMTQETKNQMQRLRTEKNLQKIQRSPY